MNGGGNSGSRLRLGSWILYDLANTVYAAVLTFLFTDFIKAEDGGVTAYSVVNFASMAVAAVLGTWTQQPRPPPEPRRGKGTMSGKRRRHRHH